MEETGLFLALALAFLFAMFGARITRNYFTAPMVFITIGFLFGQWNLIELSEAKENLHTIAEVALVILLFLDAAQIDLKALRSHQTWPARMLVIGMPLAILIGTIVTYAFFPSWPLVACALVAALLAPTDAALGQAVISNPLIPERVRNGITVESGLNDGMALPIILLFASLTAEVADVGGTDWLLFGAQQLILGPIAGVVVGLAGSTVMLFCNRRGYTSTIYEGVGALALAGTAYLFAEVIGGNGFISAFVAGLAFGSQVKGGCKFVFEFAESDGQILVWAAFFLLGLSLLPEALANLDFRILLLVLANLFIVRPLAIWISLMGTQASSITRLFFGWFGPRGLATALFALLIIEQIEGPYADTIMAIAINAVWISALLHGISASPAARAYANQAEEMGDCAEKMPMPKSFEAMDGGDAKTS